jgi:hypothetical protein
MIDLFNGALTLNQAMIRGLRESPDAVRRGLLLVLLVGLLVGAVQGISTMISGANPEPALVQFEANLKESLTQQSLNATTPEQRESLRLIGENVDSGMALLRALATLPAPLPRPLGSVMQGLGVIAGMPLSYLGSLMLAVVSTHIAARQLGGQGSIQQMLGLGALSVAPHALDALGFIPALGFGLNLIALGWGLVILVLATSIAHRLDSGRATLAVLLYPLIGTLLLLLGCCAFFTFALVGGAR